MLKIKTDSKIIEYRKILQDIVDEYVNEKFSQQKEMVEKIAVEFNLSIEHFIKPKLAEQYENCYLFAFGFVLYYPDSLFLNFLLERNVLSEIEENNARVGDYLIYFSKGEPKHAGFKETDFILSKWGNGHAWRHKIEEVPSDYGDEVKFYKRVDDRVLKENYIMYLQSYWLKQSF